MATTPVEPLPYVSDVPDIDITRARRDFFDIWQKNVTIMRQVRRSDTEAGNYGSDDEAIELEVDKEIRVNVQGNGSDDYSRESYGIDSTSKSWHCFCLYTEDLTSKDKIIWNGSRFVIRNLNQGIKSGERVFWEFDIVSSDKDVDSYEE